MSDIRKWTDEQIASYYGGIENSEYPDAIWDLIAPELDGCKTALDIGSGPGAFALRAARSGFEVLAIDINKSSLAALEGKAKEMGLQNIATICGRWPEVMVKRCDFTICAYSFGSDIGTKEGLAKILDRASKAAYLISPYSLTQTDFLSENLYAEALIKPPSFSGTYRDLKKILTELNEPVTLKIVEYDFGFPLKSLGTKDQCALFLADKLKLPSVEAIRKHLEEIIELKNQVLWVPNPRKSAILSWKRSSTK